MYTITTEGPDGNAYVIMGTVSEAMRKEGMTQKDVDAYFKNATSSDYDHLVKVSRKMLDKLNNK